MEVEPQPQPVPTAVIVLMLPAVETVFPLQAPIVMFAAGIAALVLSVAEISIMSVK